MSILEEANKTINGPRRSDYGPPEENFERVAKMWTAYFNKRMVDGAKFTGHDVAVMMILLKCARASTSPGYDTFLDIAGYAGCAERLGLKGKPASTTLPTEDGGA